MREIKILELIYKNNVYSFEDSSFIRKVFSKFCDNDLFLTPWFALNSHNYKLYKNIDDQETLLKKILIGNILSFCKFINYRIDEKLEVDIDLKELISFYKQKPYNTFIGNFTVNINLPNFIGLGHLVSHGYGTIINQTIL